MTKINPTNPIMITGATGYVAGRIVEKLLSEGHTVHAPVRQPNNKMKLRYLNELEQNNPGKILYFKADLLEDGSYSEAMQGCELVFHTASPFIQNVSNAQRNLVDPALKGTRNVLQSVNQTPTVKRVVLTSSVAAILGDTKDLIKYPNGMATEKHWNHSSSLNHQPYSYSKTIAEKEAWKINETQNRWELVVINPTLVIGPGINPKTTSDSLRIIKQLGDGTMKMGAPNMDLGLVDVRDVATAHYNAGFFPNAQGRHIVSADHKTLLQLADMLREKYGQDYPLPTRSLPKFLVWLMAPMIGVSRKMVARNMGYPWLVDNRKSKDALQMNYRPIKQSINEFFQQLVDNHII